MKKRMLWYWYCLNCHHRGELFVDMELPVEEILPQFGQAHHRSNPSCLHEMPLVRNIPFPYKERGICQIR